MPQLADITVKKYDGTTDVVYSGIVASAGDKTPAVWRNNAVGSAPAHSPMFRIESVSNGTNNVRRVVATGVYPETAVASDGRVTVVNRLSMRCEFSVPQSMDQDLINEGAYQIANLIASAMAKQSVASGYAPT